MYEAGESSNRGHTRNSSNNPALPEVEIPVSGGVNSRPRLGDALNISS